MVHSQYVKAPIHSLFRHFLRFFSVFAFVYPDFSLFRGRFEISQPCKLFGTKSTQQQKQGITLKGSVELVSEYLCKSKFFQLKFCYFSLSQALSLLQIMPWTVFCTCAAFIPWICLRASRSMECASLTPRTANWKRIWTALWNGPQVGVFPSGWFSEKPFWFSN